MNTFLLSVLSLVGIGLYVALALRVHAALPSSLGALGGRHGRYADLGRDARVGGTPSGTSATHHGWDAQTV